MLKFITKDNPHILEVSTGKKLFADGGTVKGFKAIYKQGIKAGIELNTIDQLDDYAERRVMNEFN